VFIVVRVYFITDSVQKLLDIPSYICELIHSHLKMDSKIHKLPFYTVPMKSETPIIPQDEFSYPLSIEVSVLFLQLLFQSSLQVVTCFKSVASQMLL